MTITGGRPFQAQRHAPPARRTWPAQISRISRSFCAENVSLSISISKQASAHRSGIRPNRPVASSAASATARARPMSPALHRAAASTTSLLARCRADASDQGHRLRQLHRFLGTTHGRLTVAGGHRQLGGHPPPAHRQPVRDRPGSQRRVRASQQRCGGGEAADAQRVGRQPDQRIGAGLGIRAGQGQGAPVPAPRQRVPAELAQKGSLRAVGQRDQPAGRNAAPQHRQVTVGAAIAALPARRDGTQPQLLWRGRRRQRPTGGSVPEGGGGQRSLNHRSVTSFNHGDSSKHFVLSVLPNC